MKTCFASVATLAMAEETVLLQVKVSKDPMDMPPMDMPPMDMPPMDSMDMPPMDGADVPPMAPGTEMPPPPPPMPPPAGEFFDPPVPEVEEFEKDMEEFDVTPFTAESIDAFIEENESVIDEFMEFGDVTMLEGAIENFCMEDPNAPEGCEQEAHDLANMAFEELHEHAHETHDEPEIGHCEQISIWPHWACTDDWMECWDAGDHLYKNDVRVCKKAAEKGCGEWEWECKDEFWQEEFPMCHEFKTEYGWADKLNLPTVEEKPGQHDNYCEIDQGCIEAELGPEGWNNPNIDWGSFWGNVDACTCEGVKGVEPTVHSWYVDYFSHCNEEPHDHGPYDMGPMDGAYGDEYGTGDPYGTDLNMEFPFLKQRYEKAQKHGASKKQAMIASGLIRRVNLKELAKKRILKAAKLI